MQAKPYVFELKEEFTILVFRLPVKALIVERDRVFRYNVYLLQTLPEDGKPSVKRMYNEYQLKAFRRKERGEKGENGDDEGENLP